MALHASSSDASDSNSDLDDFAYRRRFKKRINFSFDLTDFSFKEKFRVSKISVEYLINRIGARIEHPTTKNKALTPCQQILCTLHWMGSGSQYHVSGDNHGVSKATIHRSIKRVTTAIVNEMFGSEVRWPENSNAIPHLFREIANIPRIGGVIDGSLIPIDSPQQHEYMYVDRKGKHSINTMVVCGPNLEFFYASARWPGSVHDARVLRNSTLARQWENGWRPFPNAFLLGDSAYALKQWLITPNIPVEIPITEAVMRFLRAFKSTRRLVENALGVLKEKFPCLNHLRVQPLKACSIFLACVTLHNLEKRLGVQYYIPYHYPVDNGDNDRENEDNGNDGNNAIDPEAIEVLRELIQIFS
ncbi:putative nuclease HARBI1 [Cydia splendana]|uniref:putative nuclease HARBI1 n=1 Tax=Cydia splendana TaxID=1100963 RepID=UPI00300C715F